MTALDVPALTALTMACFEAAQDADIDARTRQRCAVLARRLRAHLVTLVSARFAAGTPALITAQRQLARACTRIEGGRLALRDLLQTLERIDVLLKALDRLTSAASEFL